ncbi:DEAD/DEAH box helicase [Ignatzschineria rhizosphaerae]|uniref:ATP-dependent RNA helicase RhlB n=1 Tax=Ignatzschineria rhizosphaerae TaxID=2923279 RepID=A0ABY3X9I1_9GAMM|nr:DEAD/DEAH box helicase [Ignatzschineria rhizosphaerae]UNM96633.1 DEAD/DEAH box helicase [Ignatzschineria rhizosphaerae]
MGKPHLTSMKFTDLNLHDSLKESLVDNGYEFCTEIQEKALPVLLKGQDVTGQAQTGTGKTATFLLATLNHLMTVPVEEGKKGPYAIIMAPTRELAVQIHEDAKMLGRYTGLKYALLYGGAAYGTQNEALEADPDIVIGTVGRILDYFKQKKLNLRNVEVFVLDEADRMFDLGFISDIRFLLRQMPKVEKRQNMLFSATFSQRIFELAYEHMNDAELVKVEAEQVTGSRITQRLYHVSSDEKLKLLFGLLKKEKAERSIVFVNTKRSADEVFNTLNANGYKAAVLSGDIPQNRREKLLEEFKNGELSIMVATDVAARGLHIPDVTHVFNYDLPQDVEDYVHRIGRTARAGAEGTAITFACEEYVYSLMDIQDYIKEEIPVESITEELLITPEVTPPPAERRDNRQRRTRNNPRNNQHRGPEGAQRGNRRQPRRRQEGEGNENAPVAENVATPNRESEAPEVAQGGENQSQDNQNRRPARRGVRRNRRPNQNRRRQNSEAPQES